jgi:hypothetical protein
VIVRWWFWFGYSVLSLMFCAGVGIGDAISHHTGWVIVMGACVCVNLVAARIHWLKAMGRL